MVTRLDQPNKAASLHDSHKYGKQPNSVFHLLMLRCVRAHSASGRREVLLCPLLWSEPRLRRGRGGNRTRAVAAPAAPWPRYYTVIHRQTQQHIHTQHTRVRTHGYTHIHTRTRARTRIHTDTHTHTRTHTHAYGHTDTKDTHTHTRRGTQG